MQSHRWPSLALTLATAAAISANAAHAALVFQADFNGNGTGTAGAADMVTQGGTALLTASTGFTSTVVTSSSLANRAGGYLHVQAPASKPTNGASINSGVLLTPSSRQNASFDSWIGSGTSAGGASYVSLHGALDFFYRSSLPFDSTTTGTNTIRMIDTALGGAMGNNGLRFILNNSGGNKFTLTLMVNKGGGQTNSYISSSSAFTMNADALYHIGVTISTNETTGLCTMKLFVSNGDGAIDTASTPLLTYALPSIIDPTVIPATAAVSFSEPTNASGQFRFGKLRVGDTDETGASFDFDSLRLYNDVPQTFSAIAVPEAASLALMAPAIAGYLVRRKR